jgi:hypothetical protein
MSVSAETDALLEYQRNVERVQQQIRTLAENQLHLMKSLQQIRQRCRDIKHGIYQSRQVVSPSYL